MGNDWLKRLSPEKKAAWLAERRLAHQQSRTPEGRQKRVAKLKEALDWESQPRPHSWRVEKKRRANAAWYALHPGYERTRHLERKYQLSPEEFQALVKAQNFKCAMCDRHDLVVDHDHTSGKVRGLLCQRCNKGLGLLQDSEKILQAAIVYLAKQKGTNE